MEQLVKQIIESACDDQLAYEILSSYQSIEKQYFLKYWKNRVRVEH